MTLQWLASPEWANIVKALLHTLWQGAVLAVSLGFALRQLHDPVARYRSSLAALAGGLLAGLITWALLNQPLPQSISPAPIPVAAAVAVPVVENNFPTVVVNVPLAQPKRVELRWTAWLALIWLAGAMVMLGRAGIQVAGAEQLRRAALPLDDSRITELLAEARKAVGLARRVRLAVTDQLTSPAVVGVLVPTLILPLSLTASLTPEQIRFILLHELAHIRRGDYFANLFQLFAEALLFFNPAVWWISRQMRLEREACCDALAIELSGAPADYARTLVHVAENILQPAPAAATAFGDKREPSSLADRVQRMLVPGYRPKLRLTWRAMLAALFVGGALLTLSAIGTRATVAAILSPEQRIERIEKKMTALGEKPVAANYSDDEHAPKVKISGIIRTADNSPVPKWVSLRFNSTAGRSSYGTGYYAKDGKFSTSVRAGIIQIGAEANDFAPFALKPLDGLATNSFENIEIILERGFEATLQVVDADSQKPLPDVRVATIYWIGHSGFQSRSTNTDASGVITLPHSADLPIDAAINTPGYEITKKHFDHVRTNEPLRVSLRRGATLTGTVLDQATHKPLADAEFHLLYQATGEDAGHFEWSDSMRTLGSSGANGAFVLNQLHGGVKYYLGVSAPGHESVVLKNIFADTSNLLVQLGPELIVRGHVNGSLDELQIINHDRTLEANTTENFENNSLGHSEWVVLHETNGVVTFQFTNHVAGLVTLTGRNGYREEREVTAPIDDWIVNITEKRSREAKFLPKREVVFHFKHPSGVAPRGTVEVLVPDNLDPQHGSAHYEELQITNSEVRVPIAMGGWTSIVPKRMVGFWFNRTGNWTSTTGEHGDWMSIEVGSHAAPLVIEVPLIPAGAIYARAKNADGTPAGGLFFGVTELKRAPGRDQNSLDSGNDNFENNSPRQWISGPLPLGGKYQIHAWRGNSFCVSGPVKLTESEPDAEVELQFVPGKTFDGQLLDADGKPLRDVELKTTFNFPDNHGFGLKSVFTDEQGRFQLTDTTPDVGEYSIETAVPGLLAEKVVLNFGAQPQVIRLKRGRTLAGRVVDSVSGQPIPEMEVRALDYESNKLPMQTTHTDADGHFEFTSLGDANYTLYPDGGELLGRPTYGNLKFRADGRTNLVLTVKLYEWSKLKPKVAPANSGTNQVNGILSDPNFRTVLHELEKQGDSDSSSEPVATTTSGRMTQLRNVNRVENVISQIQQQNYSNNAALGSEQPNRVTNTLNYSGPGRQRIVEKLNRIRLDSVAFDNVPLHEVLRQLYEKTRQADPEHKGINFMINPNADQAGPAFASPAGVLAGLDPATGLHISPTGAAALDVGQFTVKLNLDDVQLADVLVAIVEVAQNPNPGDSRKINYAIKDYGIVFQPKTTQSPRLFTREFKMDTNNFYVGLKQVDSAGAGATTNSSAMVSARARKYFSSLGVNLNSPPGKTVFYNDGSGHLLVRATEQDLDTIEQALHALNEAPPQLHIKARFIVVPRDANGASGFDRYLGQINMVKNVSGAGGSSPPPNVPVSANWPRGVFPGNATASTGVPRNSVPVAAPITGILTDSNFRVTLRALENQPGFESLGEPEVTTTSGRQTQMRATEIQTVITNLVFQETATNSGIVPQTKSVETGPVLDVVPYVLADGYTINLALIPSVKEFLGYEKSTSTKTTYNRAGDKIELPIVLPRFATRQVVATINLGDNQTVVLGGLNSPNVSVSKDKVPVLGDIPVISQLFRSQHKTEVVKDVLVFITATIVDPAGNRVHSDEELEPVQRKVPAPPPMRLQK